MHIAVVGGGPAGCRVSELLAHQGHRVTLVDSQGPWEKPCGGGLTSRALELTAGPASGLELQKIDRITVYFGDHAKVVLVPSCPLAVASRKQLGIRLLDAARRAGVEFLRARASRVNRTDAGWTIDTGASRLQADFIIGADGATSLVRRSVSTPISSDDLSATLGCFIPGETSSHMKIFFLPAMAGYIWSFPRPGHISYGLITRPDPGWTPRAKSLLENFIEADLGAEVVEQAEFYSAPVPCLGPGSWARNTVGGPGWALLGDAAGLVDSITGEGVYYALRSAELLADAFPDTGKFAATLQSDCIRELARASRMYGRFYRGRFLGGNFRKRMVQVAGRSPTLRTLLGDMIAGNQPYTELKKKLAFSAPRVAFDLLRTTVTGSA